jgi:hypothetical protein
MLLVVLAPREPVVGGRRDQQRRRRRGAEEGEEVRVLLQVRDAVEALGERHTEQEGEEHLDAGERDAELVEQLDQLAVELLLVALVAGHAHIIPWRSCPRYRKPLPCERSRRR